MKKLMIGMMATAFASVALCDVTPALVSENLFGSIEVKSKSEFTFVAVPFEGFASQFADSEVNDGQPVPNAILARDVVAVENLLPMDTLSLFKPADAQDAEDKYHNYIARKAKVKLPGYGTVEYMEWLASMAFDDQNMEADKSPDPDLRLVPVGSGMFIGRDTANLAADNGNPFSIFAFGQIPQSYDYEQTITLNVGKTTLCAPGELAYEQVNLNELNWGGDIVGLKNGVFMENDAYVQYFGVRKVLNISGLPADADMIVCYDPNGSANTLESRIEFVNCDGKWYKKLPQYSTMASGDEKDAVIPKGLAFWFVKQKGGAVTFSWTSVPSTEGGDSAGGAEGGN